MKKTAWILLGLLVLGIGYYLISPLFIVEEVYDPEPEMIEVEVLNGMDNLSEEEKIDLEEAMRLTNSEPAEAMLEDAPEVMSEDTVRYAVMETPGHPATGQMRVIETAGGAVLRFENFETINGPQLRLYLAKDLQANDYVDLGPIRGTKGEINYLVPEGIDIADYRYVMHWCEPFRVLFNYVDLGEE